MNGRGSVQGSTRGTGGLPRTVLCTGARGSPVSEAHGRPVGKRGRARRPSHVAVVALLTTVAALASAADVPQAVTLDEKTGQVRQAARAGGGTAFEVTADTIEVETSLGKVTNDPKVLAEKQTGPDKGHYVYRSDLFDLTVDWTITGDYAERGWSLTHRKGEPFHVVGVIETLRFKESFARIDLHTDGSTFRVPINLFLRSTNASLAVGVTYPWVKLGPPMDNEATDALAMTEEADIAALMPPAEKGNPDGEPQRWQATLSYEIEMDVAAGETFASETTFIVPCGYVGAVCQKDARPSWATGSEPMDYGEVWAMQAYVRHRVPESPLPVDGYFVWQNLWWAGAGGVKGFTPANLVGTGIQDVMEPLGGWGLGGWPTCGEIFKKAKPGEKLELPAKTIEEHKALREKGLYLSSFWSPANPFFQEAHPTWLSVSANQPYAYLGQTYNCYGNRAYAEAVLKLQVDAVKDTGGRFWAWDGRTLSFNEVGTMGWPPEIMPLPCYGKDHGHLPGKQFFQEYRNIRWMIEEFRRQHPRVCFQTYWGLKRAVPWVMKGLNAIEGYLEVTVNPLDQRQQAWYTQQYRFMPVYVNWEGINAQTLDALELDLITALSVSTHSQLGRTCSMFMGELREPAIAMLKKWVGFADGIRPYLSVKRDLFGTPGSRWVDGSAHCIKDKGYLFLFKPGGRPADGVAAVPLDNRIGLTEGTRYKVTRVHPEKGKVIGVYERGAEVLLAVDRAAEVYVIEPTTEAATVTVTPPENPAITPAFPSGDILKVAQKKNLVLAMDGLVPPVMWAAGDDEAMRRSVALWTGFLEERGIKARAALGAVVPPRGAVLRFETLADCPVAKEIGLDLSKLENAPDEAHVISARLWKGRPLVLVVGKTAAGADAGASFLLSKVVCKPGREGGAWALVCAPFEKFRAPFFRGREATLCPTGRQRFPDMPEWVNYETWDKERLERYPAFLKACGFNSVQLMELITYHTAKKKWADGYRGGAGADKTQQTLHTLADAAHANGMTVSQYIWGSPADGCKWADPKTRPAREEFYRELAKRYGTKVDHIITHWLDEGHESGYETPLTATMFLWNEYKKHNPKVKATCDAWCNPELYKGIDDEKYASKDVGIALHRWWDDPDTGLGKNPAWAEQIVKAGRKVGIWGWYLGDFEMTYGSFVYAKTLDAYFGKLPPQASQQVDWLSVERCFHAVPAQINLYIAARKMWEPQATIQEIVTDYCRSVYGRENAGLMEAVYQCVEKAQPEVRYGMVQQDRYAFMEKDVEGSASYGNMCLEQVKLPAGWKPNFAMVSTPQDDIVFLKRQLEPILKAAAEKKAKEEAGKK